MNKATITFLILLSSLMAAGAGHYFGHKSAAREMFLLGLQGEATQTTMSTQVLYALQSNNNKDAIKWLHNYTCGNLIILGGSIKDFSEIKNDKLITHSLSLTRKYSEDYKTDFCNNEYPEANAALDLGGELSENFSNFRTKYHAVNKSINVEPQQAVADERTARPL